MVALAADLGYRLLGVEAGDDVWDAASRACREHGVECRRRLTIEASTSREALRILRGRKGRTGIIALRPLGVDAARFAGRDTRVRLLSGAETLRYADRSQYRLLRVGGGGIEADLSRVLRGDLAYLIRLMRLCAANNIPLVLSSCAKDRWELWPPRSAASLAIMASAPLRLGLDAVYVNPWRMIR